MWKILYFTNNREERPVQKFILGLNSGTRAKVAHSFDLLENYGIFLKMPHAKKITKNLFELRTRGVEEIRILYALHHSTIYLLHAFKKKSQKIPPKEIKLAEIRLALFLNT